MSQRINQVGDIKQLLHEILHCAIANLEAERGLIILTDETGKRHQSVASETLSKEEIAFSNSIVQRTIEEKRTILSSDMKPHEMFEEADSIHELNILSFISVPLIILGRDKPCGTLYIDQRIYEKTFTHEDKQFLEGLANLAAIAINNVSHIEQLLSENIRLRRETGEKYEFPGIVGQSDAMQRIMHDIERILNDNSTVLLVGESGSGKEVVAKTIHYNGYRKNEPFLAVNCGALPETILEAELFGSVRGAFTGAIDKKGLFQAADGGTLFLDEIHHTSEAMQIKLMRALQEKEVRRIGETRSTKVDVRVICATNEDLEKMIQEKRFRRDFYYRINIVRIEIPPLREHPEDIPLLAQYFLEKYSKAKGKNITGFHPAIMESLMRYPWTENNIRELENEIERAVVFAADGEQIGPSDLSDKILRSRTTTGNTPSLLTDERDEAKTYAQLEVDYIRFMLAKTGGNKSKAAKLMGIPRTTLIGKMKKHKIT